MGVVLLDGQILANSLVSLKGTDLRMVYVLLCKTNIGVLVSAKTKDLFSKKEIDHFTKHMEAEVENIRDKDDCEIQVDLYLELIKMLKLKGTKYSLDKEIQDQCLNIVNSVYASYKSRIRDFVHIRKNSRITQNYNKWFNFK